MKEIKNLLIKLVGYGWTIEKIDELSRFEIELLLDLENLEKPIKNKSFLIKKIIDILKISKVDAELLLKNEDEYRLINNDQGLKVVKIENILIKSEAEAELLLEDFFIEKSTCRCSSFSEGFEKRLAELYCMGKIQDVVNLKKNNLSIEQIAQKLELPKEIVDLILKSASESSRDIEDIDIILKYTSRSVIDILLNNYLIWRKVFDQMLDC